MSRFFVLLPLLRADTRMIPRSSMPLQVPSHPLCPRGSQISPVPLTRARCSRCCFVLLECRSKSGCHGVPMDQTCTISCAEPFIWRGENVWYPQLCDRLTRDCSLPRIERQLVCLAWTSWNGHIKLGLCNTLQILDAALLLNFLEVILRYKIGTKLWRGGWSAGLSIGSEGQRNGHKGRNWSKSNGLNLTSRNAAIVSKTGAPWCS